MYKYTNPKKGLLKINNGYEGESIEKKVFRITNNKEPISDSAPVIYTDRSEGVLPAYNIRTDRFEVAIDGMDIVDKAHKAKREERAKLREEAKNKPENTDNKIGGTDTIQATGNQQKDKMDTGGTHVYQIIK